MPADRDEIEQISAGCTAGSVARYFLDDASAGEDKLMHKQQSEYQVTIQVADSATGPSMPSSPHSASKINVDVD